LEYFDELFAGKSGGSKKGGVEKILDIIWGNLLGSRREIYFFCYYISGEREDNREIKVVEEEEIDRRQRCATE